MTYGKAGDCVVARCWPAEGDHVNLFAPRGTASGGAPLSIAYSLGPDFQSIPREERERRVLALFKAMPAAIKQTVQDIRNMLDPAKLDLPGGESIEMLTGKRLETRFREINRKNGKHSPIVQGGLPSLGKRQ